MLISVIPLPEKSQKGKAVLDVYHNLKVKQIGKYQLVLIDEQT